MNKLPSFSGLFAPSKVLNFSFISSAFSPSITFIPHFLDKAKAEPIVTGEIITFKISFPFSCGSGCNFNLTSLSNCARLVVVLDSLTTTTMTSFGSTAKRSILGHFSFSNWFISFNAVSSACTDVRDRLQNGFLFFFCMHA